MTNGKPVLARAQANGAGWLHDADEPLAGLQMRCGGTIPGDIAIPDLRALVIKACAYGLRLARQVSAHDGEAAITAWVEVEPTHGDPSGACAIILRHWHAEALAPNDGAAAARLRGEVDRHLAELTARLDARQGVLTAHSDAPDLADLARRMQQGGPGGQRAPWTNFVQIAGNLHRQPLHWRLLDGAMLSVAGSQRPWRATLIPRGAAGGEPDGFELCLTSTVPPPATQRTTQSPPQMLVGREVAPVLRQPIARIIANAETIRTRLAGPLAEDYSRYAADIAAAGQHLLDLIDDLADLEVIERPDFTTAADAIDLNDVIHRAAGILSLRARERGITLVVPPIGAPVPATAEFRRVLQILLNLIGNAIRYTTENSQVSVDVLGANHAIQVAVSDHGAGIPEADRARVFDKYERLGRSGDGGSGLGLFISRRLARAMGGDLAVEAAPGGGARFVLELPVRSAP